MSIKEITGKVFAKPLEMQRQLNFVRAFMGLVEDPNDTNRVFALEQAMEEAAGPQGDELFMQTIKTCPGLVEMIEGGYLAPKYEVESLKDYAPGTLGYAYYHHMHDNGFSPNFFPAINPVDELNYAKLRMRQVHDIWHVMTGYDPTLLGEFSLLGFSIAQFRASTLPTLLVASALVKLGTTEPLEVGKYFDGLVEGYLRGQAAASFWPVQWEEMWNQPLSELRAKYNVQPSHSTAIAPYAKWN